MKFKCVKDCSKCCIEREYYPSIEYGKIGVLILPEEVKKIELCAKNQNLKVNILPRIGVSNEKFEKPTKIIAYQLMGRESNGNTCPFLDTESAERSPHGGYNCKIYEDRPLACKAYPIIESTPIILDSKCKFCESCSTSVTNVNQEVESLVQIKDKMKTASPFVWRYATGIGDDHHKNKIMTGWSLMI